MCAKNLKVALTMLIQKIGDYPIDHIEDDYDGITFYINSKLSYKYYYQDECLIKQFHNPSGMIVQQRIQKGTTL